MRLTKKSTRPVSVAGATRDTHLMQSLEPRRLMSTAAGADFVPMILPPLSPGDMQLNHSLQFNPAFPDFRGGQPLPPMANFGAMDPNSLPSPPLSATAQTAVPIASTAAVDDTRTASSLSTLYSTLENSTVAAIDSATDRAQASALVDSSIPEQTQNVFTAPASAAAQIAPGRLADAQIRLTPPLATANHFPITSDAALARAMSIVTPPVTLVDPPVISPQGVSPPSWAGLHKLEDELAAVKAFGDLFVAEIGRDSAIALSHLESLMETESVVMGSSTPLSAWRSVAIAGAAIAGAAYVQNRNTGEKNKTTSVFSRRLIEIIY